jgi:hypothetical protein
MRMCILESDHEPEDGRWTFNPDGQHCLAAFPPLSHLARAFGSRWHSTLQRRRLEPTDEPVRICRHGERPSYGWMRISKIACAGAAVLWRIGSDQSQRCSEPAGWTGKTFATACRRCPASGGQNAQEVQGLLAVSRNPRFARRTFCRDED